MWTGRDGGEREGMQQEGNPDGVVIRRARAEDAAGICAAHLASIRGVCSRDYTPEQIKSWCEGKNPELYLPLISRFICYVAEEQGRIGGFGEVQVDAAPGAAEVRGLYLAPEFVGRG